MIENDRQELEQVLSKLLGTFEEKMPFNKLLGVRIESLHLDEVRLRINMREELIGNFIHGILHGGVIASVLDVAGAMIAIANDFTHRQNLTEAERREGLDKTGTIDLHISYLRPGRGKYFIASSKILRSGKRIAVTRMELHNDDNLLIAVATGCYSVG